MYLVNKDQFCHIAIRSQAGLEITVPAGGVYQIADEDVEDSGYKNAVKLGLVRFSETPDALGPPSVIASAPSPSSEVDSYEAALAARETKRNKDKPEVKVETPKEPLTDSDSGPETGDNQTPPSSKQAKAK